MSSNSSIMTSSKEFSYGTTMALHDVFLHDLLLIDLMALIKATDALIGTKLNRCSNWEFGKSDS
jgi:hypothetical protein